MSLTIFNAKSGTHAYVIETINNAMTVVASTEGSTTEDFFTADLAQYDAEEIPSGSSYILMSTPMYEEDPCCGMDYEWFEVC